MVLGCIFRVRERKTVSQGVVVSRGQSEAEISAHPSDLVKPRVKAGARGWDRPIVFGGAVLAFTLGCLILLRLFAEPLTLLFMAIVIAQALAPLVTRMERWMPRVAAIIALYSVLLVVAAAFVLFVVPPLVNEIQRAASDLPRLLSGAAALINRVAPGQGQRIVTALQPAVGQLTNAFVGTPVTTLTALGNAVQVLFLSLYWLVSMPALKRFSLSLVPASRHEQVGSVLDEISRTMGGYVRGTVIDALIVGVILYLGLLILGVDYPLLLAVIGAVGELIPIIGPTIAEALATAVALLISPTRALFVLAFYLLLEQVDGNVILPLIIRQQTNISPLLITFAVFAGAWVGGVIGALVAIPLAGAIQVLVVRVLAPLVREWTGAAP